MSPVADGLPDSDRMATFTAYLESASQSLDFPVDFVHPRVRTYDRGVTVVAIDSSSLSRLVDRVRGTPASSIMTAFAATLHLFTARQDDFVVGVPFVSHPQSLSACDTSDMVPLRIDFAGISNFDGLHGRICKDLLFLAEMQDLSRDALASIPKQNNNLIRASFTYQDVSSGSATPLNSAPFSSKNLSARTELACFIKVDANGDLRGELEYDAEIFAHDVILSISSAFSRVLDEWSNQPALSLYDVNLAKVTAHVPSVPQLDLADASIGHLLVSLAGRFSRNLAVYDDTTGASYTYEQLFSRARQVRAAVRPFYRQNGVVLLLLERNVDILAAEIGVNLAGLAWTPCDISQPLPRICDIAADANPVCVIAHQRALDKLKVTEDTFSVPILRADTMFDCETMPTIDSGVETPGELAYMIYTSGSTGKPKGVSIGHASLVAHVRDMTTWDKDGVAMNPILATNMAWDASLSSVYSALVTGGCIKISKIGGEHDGEYLSTLMCKHPKANYFAGTSAALRMWLDQKAEQPGSFFPDGMRHIILGGDEIKTEFVQRLFGTLTDSPDVLVRQVYGPTEGTILNSYGILTHASVKRLSQRRRVPIDMPMPHSAMTVATPSGNELPRGFVGEIIIWGPCLLLEYNNLPEINAQRLLVKDGVRGWRSGDLGRHLPSGEYEIFGRMDSMCKVKGGFRVELPEIQAQIQSHPTVDDCHVSLASVASTSGEKQIVAHVVFKEDTRKDLEVIENWKKAFDNYTEAKESPDEQIDLSFDHRGWTSNLGRRELTTEEMTEWIDTTIARLLEQDCFQHGRRPRVLEIGSGTGMILFRVAKFCESYTGVDLLPSAVAQVQSHARTLKLDHVKVYVSPAHLFSEIIDVKAQFDLIICNSVSQYFPSLEYLSSVIDRAGERLAPQGSLFFGDIRNHALFTEFAAAQALSSKPPSIQELGNAITTCLRTDEELLIDPGYFIRLAQESPHFKTAMTVLRRGIEVTDMTLFRYDAILRSQARPVSPDAQINAVPHASSSTSSELVEKVSLTTRPTLVSRLSNKRIAEFHYITSHSLNGSRSMDDVLSEAAKQREKSTVHDPENLLARIMRRGGVQAIPLCSISHPECFDLLVVDKNLPQRELASLCYEVQQGSLEDRDRTRSMSNKQKRAVSRQTLSDLYEHLSRRVPTYMIPDYVVPMDFIPLTNSHKVDKAKLPAANSSDRFMLSKSSAIEWTVEDNSRRETVEAILKVFASVLFTDRPLSPDDNFFLCGGHSLLATKATSLIRRELDVPLPFTTIITYPTASQLAEQVEAIKSQSKPQLPPNVVSLQSRTIDEPKAVLFAFHLVAGELDMMPQVVDQLGLEAYDVAAYGLVWEPENTLNTLEKVTSAYAESIAEIAGSTPCLLLGWCYGGMLAGQVAQKLPRATTKVLLLNSPALSEFVKLEPSYPTVFVTRICIMLGQKLNDLDNIGSSKPQMKLQLDPKKLQQELCDANIDRRDIPRLIAFAREHISLPSWVTDPDLSRYLIPLADSTDILQDIHDNYSASEFDIEDLEEQVIYNLQCQVPQPGLPIGLGWPRYERTVDADRFNFPSDPEVFSRLSAFMHEYLVENI
ncbi:acetyl-CoA synthetase-like protein [Ceratobasidium sp. AG-I]|nr:acetyl-CoA synthetase-like protein [Ceratobasidium sp. AG-I]